ncbi:4a-hydroxytetrahydrobiopterin dehydratase [Nitrosomonas sp. ANs5]|uniref:4a-hydroxytetrahydrobiopterin dehydratase n=1 Tax=Nitrosomonas sp. ANs5 TaxID=3423941 RepID=UPI003D351113
MTELPEGWEARNQPPTLFKRFEFERYSGTRNFLDALAALAEETGLHPQNINFSSTYVNITLDASQEASLSEAEFGLATQINLLYEKTEK